MASRPQYIAIPLSFDNTQKNLLARIETPKKSKIIAPYPEVIHPVHQPQCSDLATSYPVHQPQCINLGVSIRVDHPICISNGASALVHHPRCFDLAASFPVHHHRGASAWVYHPGCFNPDAHRPRMRITPGSYLISLSHILFKNIAHVL